MRITISIKPRRRTLSATRKSTGHRHNAAPQVAQLTSRLVSPAVSPAVSAIESGRVSRVFARCMLPAFVALVLLLADSVSASAQTPSILDPASPNAASLKQLYHVIFWLGVGVFFVVEGLILFTAVRFRRKSGDEGDSEHVHGGNRAEIAWTIAPAFIVLTLAAFSYRPLREAYEAPADALRVDVVGKQWFWEFHYPEGDVTTANVMVVPIATPVQLVISSADVTHSFWAPQLAGKVDALPRATGSGSEPTELWFTADREGTFDGQCAALCGTQHSGMQFQVVVLSETEFDEWLEAQQLPAAVPAAGSVEAHGLELVSTKACKDCHVIDGVDGMVGRVGPELTHVGSRQFLAGGVVSNTEEDLTSWIDHPDEIKPGSKMIDTELSPEEIEAVVSYLRSLK